MTITCHWSLKFGASLVLGACCLVLLPVSARAQGTAFTYQGRLNDGANPANGTYNLRFALSDALTVGNQIGTPFTNSLVNVSNGLFTVTLDFGANIFTNTDRFLEIAVRTNGVGSFTTLSPRQKLTPAPYAIFAENVGIGGLSAGTYGNAVTLNNAANSFSGSFNGNGSSISNVNALTLGGVGSNGFWRTTGNVGTTPGANFLGTTDNQPLELRVNGSRALRIEPVGVSEVPNLIGGYVQNSAGGSQGAVIGGGGTFVSPNLVSGNFGAVLGGYGNSTASFSVVGGGAHNNSLSPFSFFSFIGSGERNTNQAGHSVIGGGSNNVIQAGSDFSAISGGQVNLIEANSLFANISGGVQNHIGTNAGAAVIDGGTFNTIESDAGSSSVGGGNGHRIQRGAIYSVIGGGNFNKIQTNAEQSTIGGGGINTIESYALFSTIGGGYQNRIQLGAYDSTISGGTVNTIQDGAISSTISGGTENTIQVNAAGSTIGGGSYNRSIGDYATVGGGGGGDFLGGNVAAGDYSTVAGGTGNYATDLAATVAGGTYNRAVGQNSFVGGGSSSIAAALGSSVLGGLQNVINSGADYATISGGAQNLMGAGSAYGAIGGGSNNIVQAPFAAIAGGLHNTCSGIGATIGGGGFDGSFAFALGNRADGPGSVIGGGVINSTLGFESTIAGGFDNHATNDFATIPGGSHNTAGGRYSFAAGHLAQALHSGAFVWADSTVADFASTANDQFLVRAAGGVGIGTPSPQQQLSVGGGLNIDQNNANSGTVASALTFGSNSGEGIACKRSAGGNQFGLDFYTGSANRLSISNNGNVAIVPGSLFFGSQTRQMINLWSTEYGIGVQAATTYFRSGSDFSWFKGGVHNDGQNSPGTGGTEMMRLDAAGSLNVRNNVTANSLILTSDRDAKENFTPVNARAVLDKVAALPVSEWTFKADTGTRHIGPMAQDFYAAFGVGSDDKHIAVVDEGGVALAAIQGLNQKLEDRTKTLEEELKRRDAENTELKERLEVLEKFIHNQTPN